MIKLEAHEAGQVLALQPGTGGGTKVGREVVEHEAAGPALVHVRRIAVDYPGVSRGGGGWGREGRGGGL